MKRALLLMMLIALVAGIAEFGGEFPWGPG
jgi:hypothetical protein